MRGVGILIILSGLLMGAMLVAFELVSLAASL